METLKKAAVLLSGLLIIVLVVWILSLSSREPESQITFGEETVPENQVPESSPRENVKDIESPPLEKTPGPEEKYTLADTISWRTSPKTEPHPGTPNISGKMPLSGNPNPIFINAARRILPAVVSISTSRRIRHPSMDFFPHFFSPKDDENKKKNPDEEGEDIIQPGSGSGIIISDNGYIMTNYHVVEESEHLGVKLYDKREFVAQFIGGDPTTDVAILKVDQENLPAAIMGNSDSVQIGEWVMAVGNPLNFTSTITTGIISALGRNINIIDPKYRYRIENFIQTDAVINPGNSGGALINLEGEVVGINTAIATRNGFYQGYGFAIPINLARKTVNDILRYGRVRRAILGVVIEPVTDNIAKAVGLPRPTGAMIQGLTSGSPAEKVGLRQGDIILAVDGETVVSVNDLQTKIAGHHPGEMVAITIWRDRKEWEIEIKLGEAPLSNEPVAQPNTNGKPAFENLGISLRELSDEEKTSLSIRHGLLIEKVVVGSPAAAAGVFQSAILLSINEKTLSSVEEFEEIIGQAEPGDFLKFSIRMAGSEDSRILFVKVP